ncbi:hypothetical protein DMENIID0001_117460 [Sergentomyia squamirostris]
MKDDPPPLLYLSTVLREPPVVVRSDSTRGGRSEEFPPNLQPPRFIEVQHGSIFLSAHPQTTTSSSSSAGKVAASEAGAPEEEVRFQLIEYGFMKQLMMKLVRQVENSSSPYLERISELEDAVCELQQIVYQSQTGFSSAEKELIEQIDNLKRTQMAKDRRTMQICWEHRALQEKFHKQESMLVNLQHENKFLRKRILQYEHCLDDVSKRVIDAIMAEDRLRAEFVVLKNRIRDLEVKNTTATGSMGSPARGRDEGYCTMSSGPLPSTLENLPEEPEQWILTTGGGSSAEMEDWSLSQEELVAQLEEEDTNDWTWANSHIIPQNSDAKCEEFSVLLNEEIVYSESEELPCKDFTSDFYKLVSIQSESCKSLTLDDEDEEEEDVAAGFSGYCGGIEMTDSDSSQNDAGEQSFSSISEIGQEQMCSCSSSDESTDPPVTARAAIVKNVPKRSPWLPAQWKRSSGWRKVVARPNVSPN